MEAQCFYFILAQFGFSSLRRRHFKVHGSKESRFRREGGVPPNVPQCRPIKRYRDQLKGILRKTGQATNNVKNFTRIAKAATKKIRKVSVEASMKGTREKLRAEFEKRRISRPEAA